MDAPVGSTSDLQGYAAASDASPLSTFSNYSFSESSFLDDKVWQFLPPLESLDFLDSQLSADQDLHNEPSDAPHLLSHDPSVLRTHGAQSACKLQPCVYSRSSSFAFTYTPPPSGQAVELLCLPTGQPLPAQHDYMAIPPVNNVAQPVASALAAHAVNLTANMPCQYYPLPNSDAEMSPAGVLKTPPSPSSATESFIHTDIHVEANLKNQFLYHVLNDRSKLTSPKMACRATRKAPRKSKLPLRNGSTSPATRAKPMGGTASPEYNMQSNISAAYSNTSALAAARPASSSSSALTNSMLSEHEVLRGLASPMQSINDGASTVKKSSCHGTSCQVDFMVKTTLLDLYDGYKWRNYGNKDIVHSKFSRSYSKCDEKDRLGCEVKKWMQKCDNEELVRVTYFGRHNHLQFWKKKIMKKN